MAPRQVVVALVLVLGGVLAAEASQSLLIGDLADGECMTPWALDPSIRPPLQIDTSQQSKPLRKPHHKQHKILPQQPQSQQEPQQPQPQQQQTSAGAVLTATMVSSESNRGGVVLLEWSGVVSPDSRDYISMHCPQERMDIIDWIWANHSATQAKGYGQTQMLALDTRTGTCAYRYFGPSGQLVALSNSVNVTRTDPYHVHITLTNDPSEMVVQWVSTTTAAAAAASARGSHIQTPAVMAVWVGLAPDALTDQYFGIGDTYTAQDLCEAPANSSGYLSPGTLFSAVVRKLRLGTQYFYRIDGSERVFNFTTRKAVGSADDVSFLVYADMGIYDGVTYPGDGVGTARNAMAEVALNGAAMVLHPGDLGYAMGAAYVWDKWFALIEPYASLVPYMVGAGNHEVDVASGGFHPVWGNFGDDSQGECGVPMSRRFTQPAPWARRFWYSFDYQAVHFVMMNSEANCSVGSEQYQWLQADLAAVDRCATPFVVLLGHRAMYNSEMYASDFEVSEAMKLEFENLLVKYDVDLCLWGHYHAYQRTCPVYNKQCGQGPVHVTVGNAGAALDDAGLYNTTDTNYSQFFEERYGFGRLRLTDSKTTLTWEYLRNADYPAVADSYVFHRKPCSRAEQLAASHRIRSGFAPCPEE